MVDILRTGSYEEYKSQELDSGESRLSREEWNRQRIQAVSDARAKWPKQSKNWDMPIPSDKPDLQQSRCPTGLCTPSRNTLSGFRGTNNGKMENEVLSERDQELLRQVEINLARGVHSLPTLEDSEGIMPENNSLFGYKLPKISLRRR